MKNTENRFRKRLWKYIMYGFIAFCCFILLTIIGVFGKLPPIQELENPKSALASEVYSEEGKLLGKYFLVNRSNVAHDEISQNVYDALICTEDERFTEHSGIDLKALIRAVANLGKDGGGSTITQQLAKNLFHKKPRSKFGRLMQKVKEWIISIRLEKRYSKDEIITMYLNTVQFSGHSWGIKSIAKELFSKKPIDLNVNESAMIVGMLKAISAYHPKRNPKDGLKRREVVLKQMFVYDRLSRKKYDSLRVIPIKLNYVPENHNTGLGTYFRAELKKYMIKWCKANGKNLYKDGLKIYTTINYKMQEYAEKAMHKHLKNHQKAFNREWGDRDVWRDEDWKVIKGWPEKQLKRTDHYKKLFKKLKNKKKTIAALKKKVKMEIFTWNGSKDTLMSPYDSVIHMKKIIQGGFIAIDPHTGQVRSWVGGVDHRFFQYDHVNKNATRQVGSTFKPFIYSLALDNGFDPCEVLPREKVTFQLVTGDTWTPKNVKNAQGGSMTMYQGLAKSDNLITAQVMFRMGKSAPRMVKKYVTSMGIAENKIPEVPSICLGTADVSVIEMASAFTTFVNKGYWISPTFITTIEDKNGKVLAQISPDKIEQVIKEEIAYKTWKMIEGVVKIGTSKRLWRNYGLNQVIGGKTGTTQGNSDGWFMGVTKDLVTATWVGFDSRDVRFRSIRNGQGASAALPIFAYFMKDVYADKTLNISTEAPEKPKGLDEPNINCWNQTPTNIDGTGDTPEEGSGLGE